MDDYAGRVLADRYRLPLPPSDAYELVETRAFDTYSGQEVLVRQVPLPEVVDAEVLDADGTPSARRATGRTVRRSTDPAVRRAIEAAQAAAQVPDHPRLDQVFDVFAEAGSLWIVSELVAARPLAALLAERPLNPYRAAEIGSDVLTALRVLHAHGWTHRNITVRTVLVCDDGRVVLTGLAAGAAEEALCGYVPAPQPDEESAYGPPAVESGPTGPYEPPPAASGRYELPAPAEPASPEEARGPGEAYELPAAGSAPEGPYGPPATYGHGLALPGPGVPPGRDATPAPEGLPAPRTSADGVPAPGTGLEPARQVLPPAEPGAGSAAQLRAARAGAIAAYRAGARAAARAGEDRRRAEAARPGGQDGADAEEQRRTEGPDADGREPADGPRATGQERAGDAWDQGGDDPGSDGAREQGAGVPGRDGARHQGPGGPEAGGAWDQGGDDPGSDGAREQGAGGPGAFTAPGGPRLTGAWGGQPGAPYPYPYDDDEDDEDDDEGPGGPPAPGRRVHLAGTWGDGPGAGRPVPAGGGGGRSGEDALRADARRLGGGPVERTDRLPQPTARVSGGGWDEVVAESGSTPAYRGPATPLAAERARQARIAVVGAVTERWAPEQAGPVHDNWQLAPPIGPSTDLWALGALLYRAVQGHAPYPEENAAELVQMVCGEPPAFAEECGPLRPVVESLLRQDPTERPDFEELRGWLRSLVRSAPEPEAGADVVTLPPADATRLPVVRRRGELVRRRRGRGAAHGRHRQGKQQRRTAERPPAYEEPQSYERPSRPPREPKGPKALRRPQPGGRAPRRLGRVLLVLILLAMAAAVAYAMLFMPRNDADTGAAPADSVAPADPGAGDDSSAAEPSERPRSSASGSPGSERPQTSRSAVALAKGYELREDAEGFEIGVPKGWQRSPANADRQIRYGSDGFSILVVPGRDTVKANGSDPLDYQRDAEPELKPFRDSSWATSTGLRRVDVGQQAMAEGQFTWQESGGRQVYVRNLVLIVDGRYHIVQVIGPESGRDEVSEIYEQAISSYRVSS
ncbi:protein kinase [Streptomyces sp. bgisy091]|uniref:protein kinase n=1 Tax=Streptomyces sp. bgisy091 TaxID=3413778 RepID=UPI003D70CEB3